MKNFFLIILSFILILSCSTEEETEWENLKASNDFRAIENYILQNPDTKYLAEGIELIFKLKKQKDNTTLIPTYPNYYGRNTTRVIINKNSELEVISEIYNGKAELETIRQILKNYFINGYRNYNLPELKAVTVNSDEIPISKGHFYLIIDTTARIDTTRKVIKSLNKAISNYKQYLLETFFTKNIEVFDKNINESLDSLLENRILIFDIKEYEETLPKSIEEDENKIQ